MAVQYRIRDHLVPVRYYCGGALGWETATTNAQLFATAALATAFRDLYRMCADIAGDGPETVTITASGVGSFTVPPATTILTMIAAWGAGGGSDADDGLAGGAGGGGGGCYVADANLSVAPGDTVSYSVGAAGQPGTPAGSTAGGDTLVVGPATMQSKGGAPSIAGAGGAGGSAAACIGTTKRSGGTGGAGQAVGNGGGGGSSAGTAADGTNGATGAGGGAGGTAPAGGGDGGNGDTGGGATVGVQPGGGAGGGSGAFGDVGKQGGAGKLAITYTLGT